MEPRFKTSFIPKKGPTTSVASASGQRTSKMSVFYLISIIVFIASVALSAATFFYQKVLTNSLIEMNEKLVKAKQIYEPDTIEELKKIDLRIEETKKLISTHISSSAVFSILEDITLEQVSFSKFDYSLSSDNSASISLSGEAKSFNSVALQSDVFGNDDDIKNPIFSNITLNDDGTVSFDFKASIGADSISFGNVNQSQ